MACHSRSSDGVLCARICAALERAMPTGTMSILQRAAKGRQKATSAEWEALLLAVLGAEESDARAIDVAVAKRVRIDLE